ncbi:MAG TPA: Fe-S cluster assembly protein SufB, partial [Anaerolineaceae bacterium]|nr:Fe-S cluster assembly protein SufB [Anaerolineaceae bacterium]
MSKNPETDFLNDISDYQYGFSDPDTFVFKSRKGLDEEVVREISAMKGEPEWMLEFRLKALKHYQERP